MFDFVEDASQIFVKDQSFFDWLVKEHVIFIELKSGGAVYLRLSSKQLAKLREEIELKKFIEPL